MVYDYTKADYSGMCLFLLDHDFSDYFQCTDIDKLWFHLKSILREAVDKYVALVRISNRKTPKWFTPEIRHDINRLRYRRRYLNRKPNITRSTLDREEKFLQEKITKARSTWERNLVDDFAGSSNHRIYNHIRNLSSHSSLPYPMFLDSFEATDTQVLADLFNQYFHSIQNMPIKSPQFARSPLLQNSLSDFIIEPS